MEMTIERTKQMILKENIEVTLFIESTNTSFEIQHSLLRTNLRLKICKKFC